MYSGVARDFYFRGEKSNVKSTDAINLRRPHKTALLSACIHVPWLNLIKQLHGNLIWGAPKVPSEFWPGGRVLQSPKILVSFQIKRKHLLQLTSHSLLLVQTFVIEFSFLGHCTKLGSLVQLALVAPLAHGGAMKPMVQWIPWCNESDSAMNPMMQWMILFQDLGCHISILKKAYHRCLVSIDQRLSLTSTADWAWRIKENL